MRSILLSFILLSPFFVYSQNNKKVEASGEFTTKFETNNKELFELKCIETARVNAIENTFGKVVMQGNSTYIQNSTNNTKNESYNSFNFISDTYVNGEWVSDIEKPKVEYLTVKGYNDKPEIWIKVNVQGYVKEITTAPISFQFSTLSCDNNINCKSEEFKDKQDIFFYFKAPVSGYLAIYLDVPPENKTYKIFPYQLAKNPSNIRLEKDKEYILFSKKKNSLPEQVNEIVLSLTKPNKPEVNKLFVLFSPDQEIVKPLLTTNKSTEKNFQLPDSISSPEFQKWIQLLKSYNKTIQVSTSYITINP